MLNRYSGISWYSYLKHKLNHSSISNLYLFLFLFLFLKLFHLFIFQILSPPGPPLPEFFTSYPSHLLLRRCSPPIVLCPPYPTLGIPLLWLISSLLDQVHPLPLRTDKAVLCYICPGGHGPAQVPLCLVSGGSQDSRLVSTAILRMELPSSSALSILPLTLLQVSPTSAQ